MICSIEFIGGSNCECLEFIRHLFAVPTLLQLGCMNYVAKTSANLIVEDCLTLTDKFTELCLPTGTDTVTSHFSVWVLTCLV